MVKLKLKDWNNKRALLLLLLPAALLLVQLAKAFPALTDQLYSRGLYRLFQHVFGRLFSPLPFSFAEMAVLFSCIAVPLGTLWLIRRLIQAKGRRRAILLRLLANLSAFVGVGYFLFTLLCGLNYHRLEFAIHSGLTVRPSSVEEVASLYEELVGNANLLRRDVMEDHLGTMQLSFGSTREMAGFAAQAYAGAGEIHPVLAGYTATPKPVLLSKGMSWLHISGIYIPFTFEANVNVHTVDYVIPSSMMHELAHFKGFMREDEANFISYLACVYSGNHDFAYSGTMLALVHTGNALYAADRDLYFELAAAMSDGVRKDLDANSAYWRQFEGRAAEVSTAVNNTYLRSNNQQSGVKSYGRMVDLLLAEYRQKQGLE